MLFTTILGVILAALLLRVLAAVALRAFRARRLDADYVDFPTDDEVIAAIKSSPRHFASAVTTQKIGSRNKISVYAHKPNATTAQVLTPDNQTTRIWLDMRDFERFAAICCNHTLTGNGVTDMAIVAASDTSGTNQQTIVDSGTLSGTLVDNGAFLECTAAQIKEVAAAASVTLRYVSVSLTVANSSDTLAVCLIRYDAVHPQLNNTPATF